MSSNQQHAVALSVAAVIVFVSAFMPWGTIHNAQLNLPTVKFSGQMPGGNFGSNPFGQNMNPSNVFGGFPGMTFDFSINGWNGYLNLGGLQIPNWLVVFASAGVAALAWLSVNRVWVAPVALLFAVAGYAALHTIALSAILVFNGGSIGFGLILAVLATIGMLVVLGQAVRRPKMDSVS